MFRKPHLIQMLGLLAYTALLSCEGKVSFTDDAGTPLKDGTGGATLLGTLASTGGAASTGGTVSPGGNANSTCSASAATSSCASTCTGNLEECNGCGLCVAKMVTIAASPSYKIDATEVTQGQYLAWLATNPPLHQITDSVCPWKSLAYDSGETYSIKRSYHESAETNVRPVVGVDWCDAYSYCRSVGKRLCGKIGGGSNAFADFADATRSEWYRVCSSGGVNKYPYGNTHEATYCDDNTYATSNSGTVAVGSLTRCQSSTVGYAGVFDLVGNAREWEDSCEPATPDEPTGVAALCRVRGGDFIATSTSYSCDFADSTMRYNAGYNAMSFRCCSD